MWTIVMTLPYLINYLSEKNPAVAQGLLVVVYPAVISFMARHSSFWVSPYVIMISVIASYAVYMILTLGFKTDDRDQLTWWPLAVFIVTLGVASSQIDMYGPNVVMKR
jgi:hypothetical protein